MGFSIRLSRRQLLNLRSLVTNYIRSLKIPPASKINQLQLLELTPIAQLFLSFLQANRSSMYVQRRFGEKFYVYPIGTLSTSLSYILRFYLLSNNFPITLQESVVTAQMVVIFRIDVQLTFLKLTVN